MFAVPLPTVIQNFIDILYCERGESMAITCCKDCKLRSETCHSTCPTYRQEKIEHNKRQQQIHKNANPYYEHKAYIIEQRSNALRKRHYRY